MATLAERLIKGSARSESGCLEWVGYRTALGYGRIFYKKKAIYAHRANWAVHFGEIPAGMFVCHRCDNPACLEPTHLFLGTQADNMRDMQAKARRRGVGGQRGCEHHRAKATPEMVALIRADPRSHCDLARAVGLSPKIISRIRNLKTYRGI